MLGEESMNLWPDKPDRTVDEWLEMMISITNIKQA